MDKDKIQPNEAQKRAAAQRDKLHAVNCKFCGYKMSNACKTEQQAKTCLAYPSNIFNPMP